MQCELEGGDNPEVAAAAAQGPEHLRLLVLADSQQVAIGCHQIGRDDIVAGETEISAGPTDPTAECQPTEPGVGYDARWRHQAPLLGQFIDVAQEASPADTRDAPGWVDHSRAHPSEIHDQSVADRQTGYLVPTAAD